jgi:hypothetical protein
LKEFLQAINVLYVNERLLNIVVIVRI